MKKPFQKLATTSGLVAPILYTVEALINGALQPGYSFAGDHISELAQFPHGWVQDITFTIFGALEAIFVLGLLTTLRRSRRGLAAFAALLAFSLGAIGGGFFPEPVQGLGLHGVVSSVAFIAILIAMLMLGLYWTQQKFGQAFAYYTFVSFGLATATFLIWIVIIEPKQGLAIHDPLRVNSPFGHWIGLAQRLNVVIWLIWLFVAAVVARRRLARQGK